MQFTAVALKVYTHADRKMEEDMPPDRNEVHRHPGIHEESHGLERENLRRKLGIKTIQERSPIHLPARGDLPGRYNLPLGIHQLCTQETTGTAIDIEIMGARRDNAEHISAIRKEMREIHLRANGKHTGIVGESTSSIPIPKTGVTAEGNTTSKGSHGVRSVGIYEELAGGRPARLGGKTEQ